MERNCCPSFATFLGIEAIMQENDSGHGAYVDKVREDTQRYIKKLLFENEALRTALVEIESESARLSYEAAALRRDLEEQRSRETNLQERLADVRAAGDQYMLQFMKVEQHNANLANLYVASYQLHGTLDRAAVVMAIEEIVVNLIGSESFAIFEYSPALGLELIGSVGLTEAHEAEALKPEGRVRRTIDGGEAILLPPEGDVVACIPLKLDGNVTGVIAINALLPHKTTLEPLDYELFDLLASHAATALYCTSLHERSRWNAAV
jgi:regulator of replication initiation timing